jgi:hypothetical protein
MNVWSRNECCMFCTGGGAWVSSDLINRKYGPVQGPVRVAPGVVKYNGCFYMSGNDSCRIEITTGGRSGFGRGREAAQPANGITGLQYKIETSLKGRL